MRTGRILLGVTLGLGLVTPVFAAPTLKVTVGHMCCGRCETNVKSDVSAVAWIADAQTSRADRTLTVTAKPGMELDAMALFNALYVGGFPASEFQVTGAQALKMEVGHICCGSCAASVKQALAKVNWIDTAQVSANAPVMIKVKSGMTADVMELLHALVPAGFSVKSLVVTG